MSKAYYSDSIENFISADVSVVLGQLSSGLAQDGFCLLPSQQNAWREQIESLKHGMDYALDLKNFHSTSHENYVVPVLIATEAEPTPFKVEYTLQNDRLLAPLRINPAQLQEAITNVLSFVSGEVINPEEWQNGRYSPTPTIIEAALSLYAGHHVAEISRNDASHINLMQTTQAVSDIVENSRTHSQKSICFLTGVPGAGKTLVGLNIATKHTERDRRLQNI